MPYVHRMLPPLLPPPQVLDQGGSVTWEDIAGQAPAKRLVNEMVVWPMLNPGLFQVRPLTLRRLLSFQSE